MSDQDLKNKVLKLSLTIEQVSYRPLKITSHTHDI